LGNAGFVVLALAVGWITFGGFRIAERWGDEKISKSTGYAWYYLLTLQLLLLTQMVYFSLYALLKYTLNNKIDAINTAISLFFFLSVVFFLAALYFLTANSHF
jgi:hypothetical protein